MSYEVIWETVALEAATRFMKQDPEGLRQVFAAADLLGENPQPPGAYAYGSGDVRRIHCGRYRLIYEIHRQQIRIAVVHLGRVP
ncbi:plasmid stabilization protein [Streptomyces sp. AcH 505]|uniref:type II toxin-antitoxin system RelE family toxin n=1 Tax=Streptomyces sp. AcH 505 TaxID=352211 RepID=UPI000591BE11|nr:plasmid stabilization protein [Streptomyces sp. AcH 505]